MSFRCPDCKHDDALYREVDVPGWQDVDNKLEVSGSWPNGADVEWEDAYFTGNYGCGECEWKGGRDSLEEIGLDGNPLPNVHVNQISIEEALDEESVG